MTPGHLAAYGSGRAHFLPISSYDLTTARQRGQIPTGRSSFSAIMEAVHKYGIFLLEIK
jgi:hypothetical protein